MVRETVVMYSDVQLTATLLPHIRLVIFILLLIFTVFGLYLGEQSSLCLGHVFVGQDFTELWYAVDQTDGLPAGPSVLHQQFGQTFLVWTQLAEVNLCTGWGGHLVELVHSLFALFPTHFSESVDITDCVGADCDVPVNRTPTIHRPNTTEGKSVGGPYESKNRISICGMQESPCRHLFLSLIVLIL